jgi:hypothetical protein
MPWVRFEPGVGKVEESEMAVFLRGNKRNDFFTVAAIEMTLHDSQKLLDLYYTSAEVRECEEKQDDKTEQETPKI